MRRWRKSYSQVLIHDFTTAEIAVVEMDYTQRLRPISAVDVVSSQPGVCI